MKMRYFYTTHTPYTWSSGPTVSYLDPYKGLEEIPNIERAREIARSKAVDSHDDDRVVTTYGITFEEDWSTAPEKITTTKPPTSKTTVQEFKPTPRLCNHYRHRRVNVETQAGYGFEHYFQCDDCGISWSSEDYFPRPSPFPTMSEIDRMRRY